MTRPQARRLIAGVQRGLHPRLLIEQLGVDAAEARGVLNAAGQSDAAADVDKLMQPRGRGA